MTGEIVANGRRQVVRQIRQRTMWSRRRGAFGIAGFLPAASLLLGSTSWAFADPLAIPIPVPATPRYDASDLQELAPPSNAATARQTYGDAVFARRPRHFGSTRQERAKRSYVCLNKTLRLHPDCPTGTALGYRNAQVLTPSYVSAPQIFDDPIGLPSPLRSPFVTFFKNTFASPDVP